MSGVILHKIVGNVWKTSIKFNVFSGLPNLPPTQKSPTDYSLFTIGMVLNHFNRYPLGLVSMYSRTYDRMVEFIIALTIANFLKKY